MASRSTKNNNRPGSPLKKAVVHHFQSALHQEDYGSGPTDGSNYYGRNLTERDVENDHLKNTIIALSEQVAVRNPFKTEHTLGSK